MASKTSDKTKGPPPPKADPEDDEDSGPEYDDAQDGRLEELSDDSSGGRDDGDEPATPPPPDPRRSSGRRKTRVQTEPKKRPQFQNQLSEVDGFDERGRGMIRRPQNQEHMMGPQTGGQVQPNKKEEGKNPLKLRLDLNLDIQIELKAKIHGDLTLTLLESL